MLHLPKELTSSLSDATPKANPPCNELPLETDRELAKRAKIQAVMKDTTLSWAEKQSKIQEISKELYSAPDEQDAEESRAEGSTMSLLDEVRLNEPDLDEVELDGRDISKDDAVALFRDLASNTHVTFVSMAGCQLDNECVAALADALKVNKTLVEINLEENNITSNAAQSLIKVLKEENNTLQYLELKDNKVRSGLLTQIEKLLEPRRSE